MRKLGILPAFACLKMVTADTFNSFASSRAVKACSILAIRSGKQMGSDIYELRLRFPESTPRLRSVECPGRTSPRLKMGASPHP